MPRRDDDSGEYERTRRRAGGTGNSIALWLILSVVGGILLLCGGVTAFGVYVLYAGAKAVGDTVTSMQKQEQERAKWTRDEFTALVKGKTPDEVTAAVGKPDSTQKNDLFETWYYNGRTRDPVSGRVDFMAQVVFMEGVVKSVNY